MLHTNYHPVPTLFVAQDGSFDYDPTTSSDFNELVAGETATDTFTYTADDGQGGMSQATVTITITGVSDAPIATDNLADVVEDTVLTDSGNLLTDDDGFGTDSDVEDEPLTVSSVNGATDPTMDVVGLHGTLAWNADGSYTYMLDNSSPAVQGLGEGEVAFDTFTYTANDGNGDSIPALLTVTITGTNDGPVALNNDYSTDEDSVLPGGNVITDDTGSGN